MIKPEYKVMFRCAVNTQDGTVIYEREDDREQYNEYMAQTVYKGTLNNNPYCVGLSIYGPIDARRLAREGVEIEIWLED